VYISIRNFSPLSLLGSRPVSYPTKELEACSQVNCMQFTAAQG